jgi:hypothetical protein
MQTDLIGELEVTYQPGGSPALLIHHLIRGRDLARLSAAEADELRELLAVNQKRIRELSGGHRLVLGSNGDFSLYTPDGQRVCYFNPDQSVRLARLLQPQP